MVLMKQQLNYKYGIEWDEIIEQRVFGEEKIQILKRAGKLGLGSAYMDGLNLVRGDFIFLMDADLSHHVSNWIIVYKIMA